MEQPLPIAIGSKVMVSVNGREGTVIGHYLGRTQNFYDVEYVDANGAIFNRYCRPEEISN